jgi:hypothetical protein
MAIFSKLLHLQSLQSFLLILLKSRIIAVFFYSCGIQYVSQHTIKMFKSQIESLLCVSKKLHTYHHLLLSLMSCVA